MSLSRALATNNFGPFKIVVATSPANGNYTTLAAALAAASVGDTVYMRDSVTENVTLPAGVNIASIASSSLNTPTIIGKITMTAAGTSEISGLRLQTNSDFAISVTGSAASILNIYNCFFNFSNNTGIQFTSSSSSAQINCINCSGNLGTTGIAIYTSSSAGALSFAFTNFTNTGGSTTASSSSAGTVGFNYSGLFSPISASAGTISFNGGFINTIAQNVSCITLTGTAQAASHTSASFASGSASALDIGSGTTFNNYATMEIFSTNTNAITGAGLFQYGTVVYSGSSSTNNVTTQTAFPIQSISSVAYTPICGGTTANGKLQQVASTGTAGQVLTSNGNSALPSFQNVTPSSGQVVQQIRSSTVTKTQYTTVTSIPFDDTIPQNTEGAEILTATITPTNASNILWIQAMVNFGIDSTVNNQGGLGIWQDSTANAVAMAGYWIEAATVPSKQAFFSFFITAGTTSSTTFRLRFGGNNTSSFTVNGASNARIYGGVLTTNLSITEIQV